MGIMYHSVKKKSRFASTTAPILVRKQRQAFATVSVSKLPITSLIVTTREATLLWWALMTSNSKTPNIKKSRLLFLTVPCYFFYHFYSFPKIAASFCIIWSGGVPIGSPFPPSLPPLHLDNRGSVFDGNTKPTPQAAISLRIFNRISTHTHTGTFQS